MNRRVYPIHRAAGRPVVFKGFKGPFILIAGLTLITDVLVFVLLYVSGVSPWICIATMFGAGWLGLARVAGLSRGHGSAGVRKGTGKGRTIRVSSRRQFFTPLNQKNYVQERKRVTAEDGVLRTYPHQ
ncbi:MAG TPA: DUF4133 domain-containing protein [Puia sp.]|nr:DUF4133 domain-containing protein [Puia sp.]